MKGERHYEDPSKDPDQSSLFDYEPEDADDE